MSETVSINVSGMKCGGCENTVNTAVSAIDGVVSVKASHQDKRVDVEYDPDKTDLDEIEDAIIDAGFSVE
ncbi:heavy-metal-associated domain-containing protein [Methylomonas sp. LL1]|uniref:heavy-metal-associated domain-containing protein n=1 Tax=Methylomonas sp. LL1 TaxID=2785785 RepID=UPI0018C35A16|nr:heavy-metal-associated domain-containing protein [Methylomonas sp. LL1]QPK65080.1 heavy-metal-associated domain-containing protein [Methylomonas sp. LL1]